MSYITYPTYVLPNDLNVNSVTASVGFTGSFIGDGSKLINIPSGAVDLSAYATLTGVSGTFISQSQLAPYATLTGVSGTFVSQSQLADYATLTGVSGTFVTNTAATASLAFLTASNVFTDVNTFNGKVIINDSLANGYNVDASGQYSHAEGDNTVASNNNSHAEGEVTRADGISSHAEGSRTIAFGDASHAEGYKTKAIGDYSHAEGYQTTASAEYQHVQGQFNQTSSTALALIGNGTADNARSNILEVYAANVVISGGLNITGRVTASAGVSGSFIGDGSGLVNIPTSAINGINNYATLTGVSGTFVTKDAATASLAFLTASNVFTAVNTFQNAITGANARFTGDLYVNGTASIAMLNTVNQNNLQIGDRYITILSGASSQAEMDGAGILFGSGSNDTPRGEQNSVAHIIYKDAADQIEIFPGLKVSGSLTASAASSFTEATASVGFSGGSFAGTSFSGSSTLSVGGLSTFGGSVIVPMRTATANYSISATTDYIVAFNGNNLTGTLPSASGVNGLTLIVKNTHTSPLFITSSVSTIDGGPSVTISTQYNSYTFVSDNTNWLIV